MPVFFAFAERELSASPSFIILRTASVALLGFVLAVASPGAGL
jgi:hypothetical protein